MEYKSWNRNKNKWETIKIEEENFGKSRTDRSKYRPNVSSLTGAEGATDIKGEYDFKDGKDDGSTNYLLRNKGLDIVELQERAEKITGESKDFMENLEEIAKAEAENATGLENVAPRTE